MDVKRADTTSSLLLGDPLLNLPSATSWMLPACLLVLSVSGLFNHCRIFRYCVKVSFFYITLSVVSFFSILPSLLRPMDPRNLMYCANVLRGKGYLFGVEFEMLNAERISKNKRCILVANHQNALDIMGIVSHWHHFHPCVPVMKKELIYSGPVGVVCWLAGSVFVDRKNTSEGRAALNRKLDKVRDGKLSLFVFPEGTRNSGPKMLPFKKGAFHMAVQCQVPIVPIVFSSYSDFFNANEWMYNKGSIGSKVTMTVLPEMSTEGLSSEHVTELSRRVYDVMQTHIDEELAAAGNPASRPGAAVS
ncbi:1-acyl-sn-glycerol-3-phosphate acyltransferase alpha [Ixodes scapularis]